MKIQLLFLALAVGLFISGCTINSADQIQYSGVEYIYQKGQLIGSHTETYTYQENSSTFTLSGSNGNVFIFNGSHPDRRGSDYTHYSGSSSGGEADVLFVEGIHITYSSGHDSSGGEFDGQLK